MGSYEQWKGGGTEGKRGRKKAKKEKRKKKKKKRTHRKTRGIQVVGIEACINKPHFLSLLINPLSKRLIIKT